MRKKNIVMHRLESNIRYYQIFLTLLFTPIMLPVLVLFWQQNGLDMFDIYLLQGIFAMAVVVLEVPTGMVADRLGKRASLIYGTALFTLGHIVYALGYSFMTFLIAELIMALGLALVSGADAAFLYDSLYALNRKEEYTQIEGRARSWQLISLAASNVIGGFVGSYNYRLTLWLSAIGPLLALWLAFRFVEPSRALLQEGEGTKPKETFREAWTNYLALLKNSWKFVRKHQLVRWYISLLALLMGSGAWLLWMYQPYMKWTGLPVWAFGIAFAIFNLGAAAASRYAHDLQRRMGAIGTIFLFMILMIAPLLLMSVLVYPLSFLLILGHQFVRGVSRPIINGRILQYTYDDKRATVLSFSSLGTRLFFALTAPLVGWVSKHYSIPQTLWVQAIGLTLLFLLLFVWYRRIPPKYFQVKPRKSAS